MASVSLKPMRTAVHLSQSQIEKTNRLHARNYQRRYWRWRLLGERSDFSDSYQNFSANKHRGPLTPEQVAEYTQSQCGIDSDYPSRSKEMDVTIDIGSNDDARKRFALVLREILTRRPDIKTIANIGARVDFYSAYLAIRFPDREFISVDLQPNLALHNSLLPQNPNWSFMTGYWFDLAKSGRLKADLYFSVSTTVLMNNRELDAYLDFIGQHAKAFAVCEGWWPRADRIIDLLWPRPVLPEQIPESEPYCSGDYANYHHNYPAKLTRRGYNITLAQIEPYADNWHYLQLVAER